MILDHRFVSGDSLVDLWEAGGVVNAQGLLLDLGLTPGSEVNLAAVAAILEEEVRTMASKCATSSPQANALTAALALAQMQLKFSRSVQLSVGCCRCVDVKLAQKLLY